MEFGPMTSDDHKNVIELSTIFMEKVYSAIVKSKADIKMTIFRVPENIHVTNNVGSFEPKIVSFGPYHHGNERFRATSERIKWSYAINVFCYPDMDLIQSIVERFKRSESTSRCAYSEQISMTSDEFVQMMMLDCAFMAEFLKEQAMSDRRWKESSWTWAVPSIVNDMLMVENQFPLRLLFDLIEIMKLNVFGNYHPIHLDFIMQKIHLKLSPTSQYNIVFPRTTIERSEHLLHLFHSMLVAELQEKTSHLYTFDLISFPTAEKLRAMRIQFTNKTNGSSFLDIAFDKSKRIMEIPQLVIDDDNISLLRNLIAFEQRCNGVDKYISAYVWFMDCLINTKMDVAVLRQHNIIVSRLYSDGEVAQIFNELRRTDAPVVDIDHLYLAEEIENVKSHCRNRYNRLWALWNFSWLRQNYFKHRWLTIVVVGTMFFNFLSLVQTVFAILNYAKQ